MAAAEPHRSLTAEAVVVPRRGEAAAVPSRVEEEERSSRNDSVRRRQPPSCSCARIPPGSAVETTPRPARHPSTSPGDDAILLMPPTAIRRAAVRPDDRNTRTSPRSAVKKTPQPARHSSTSPPNDAISLMPPTAIRHAAVRPDDRNTRTSTRSAVKRHHNQHVTPTPPARRPQHTNLTQKCCRNRPPTSARPQLFPARRPDLAHAAHGHSTRSSSARRPQHEPHQKCCRNRTPTSTSPQHFAGRGRDDAHAAHGHSTRSSSARRRAIFSIIAATTAGSSVSYQPT
jgi:hypothetical protein